MFVIGCKKTYPVANRWKYVRDVLWKTPKLIIVDYHITGIPSELIAGIYFLILPEFSEYRKTKIIVDVN